MRFLWNLGEGEKLAAMPLFFICSFRGQRRGEGGGTRDWDTRQFGLGCEEGRSFWKPHWRDVGCDRAYVATKRIQILHGLCIGEEGGVDSHQGQIAEITPCITPAVSRRNSPRPRTAQEDRSHIFLSFSCFVFWLVLLRTSYYCCNILYCFSCNLQLFAFFAIVCSLQARRSVSYGGGIEGGVA